GPGSRRTAWRTPRSRTSPSPRTPSPPPPWRGSPPAASSAAPRTAPPLCWPWPSLHRPRAGEELHVLGVPPHELWIRRGRRIQPPALRGDPPLLLRPGEVEVRVAAPVVGQRLALAHQRPGGDGLRRLPAPVGEEVVGEVHPVLDPGGQLLGVLPRV